MAVGDVEISIKLDGSETSLRQLRDLIGGVDRLNGRLNETSRSVNNFENAFSRAGHELGANAVGKFAKLVVGVYALEEAIRFATHGVADFIKGGIELSRTIESNTMGISALITANTRLHSSVSGTASTMANFYANGLKSQQMLMDIKVAAIDAVATFPQMIELVNQSLGHAISAGKAWAPDIDTAISRVITYNKRMSNIGSSLGMPQFLLAQEVRSIMAETIDRNSLVAKVLNITNEDIKKAKTSADGLFKFLESKMASFDILEKEITFDKLVARIQDNYDTIRIESTKPIFNGLYDQMERLNNYLNDNSKQIAENITETFNTIGTASRTVADGLSVVTNSTQILYDGLMIIGNKTAKSLTGNAKYENNANEYKQVFERNRQELLGSLTGEDIALQERMEKAFDFSKIKLIPPKDLKGDGLKKFYDTALKEIDNAITIAEKEQKNLKKSLIDPTNIETLDRYYNRFLDQITKKTIAINAVKDAKLEPVVHSIESDELEKFNEASVKMLEAQGKFHEAWLIHEKKFIATYKDMQTKMFLPNDTEFLNNLNNIDFAKIYAEGGDVQKVYDDTFKVAFKKQQDEGLKALEKEYIEKQESKTKNQADKIKKAEERSRKAIAKTAKTELKNTIEFLKDIGANDQAFVLIEKDLFINYKIKDSDFY